MSLRHGLPPRPDPQFFGGLGCLGVMASSLLCNRFSFGILTGPYTHGCLVLPALRVLTTIRCSDSSALAGD
ncbi:hypothetical protein [Acinetobacter johnsonii]|uniref:hypothetical protein n=1 Tax=Acinetobacter johnsonii TaxID=40214 RepID=UPI001E4A462B|nr:hypothetical protein [Acinetobacter johnsonii]